MLKTFFFFVILLLKCLAHIQFACFMGGLQQHVTETPINRIGTTKAFCLSENYDFFYLDKAKKNSHLINFVYCVVFRSMYFYKETEDNDNSLIIQNTG